MFGKAYLLGLGLMLFFVGSILSVASNFAAGPCQQIEAANKAFDIAFNPCSIYQALPQLAFFAQGIGVLLAVLAMLLIVKTRPREKCRACSARLPKKAVFCPKCGNKVLKKEGSK